MPFKWNQSSVTITCPCGNTEEYSVDNLDVESYSEENSDIKMGATYRHIVRIYYHCPSCDTDYETEVEFIEYPEGFCESASIIDGDLLGGYDEESLMRLVDFSLEE